MDGHQRHVLIAFTGEFPVKGDVIVRLFSYDLEPELSDFWLAMHQSVER
jgi:hypothetical protein